jgi:hypothetical protein
MTPRSWVNECIPNIVWACILTATLDRDHYLSLFRSVAGNIRQDLPNYADLFVTHNFISKFSAGEFDIAFRHVLRDDQAKSALGALLLVDCLPDRKLWEARLAAPTDEHWQILAKAVAVCFDHQSEKATDIRWLKVAFMAIAGRIIFSKEQADRVESLRLFPNHGDMRQVRPFIRSTEIGMRMLEFGEDGRIALPDPHQTAFWEELYRKTRCLPLERDAAPQTAEKQATKALIDAAELVAAHFHSTIAHTSIDARHDSSFGLVLYALNLLIETSASYSHSSPIGRSTLRTIVECFITLAYLVAKDDAELWLKHRDYGNGQTKLSLLKNLASDKVPSFVDLDALEALANEDKWIEFTDINLGAWSSQNLRTMATEANLKDVYDCYYDICSGNTHGHWSAAREAAFVMCTNPLHRFHKIPAPINFGLRSVLPDGILLVNRMLDELNKIYPGLDHHINLHSHSAAAAAALENPEADKSA